MKPVRSIICAFSASPFGRVWSRARFPGGAVLAVLLATPALSHAQETRSVDVLGSITAEVNGDTLQWLTIAGGGMDGASAVWSPYAPPAVQMPSHLSEEQAAVLRERITAMSGASGGDSVELRLTGFDPEAERMLRDGGLSIEVSPFSAEESDSALAANHDAEVSLFHGRGPDRELYVSAHSAGPGANVEFDRLEIVAGGGRAEGRFAATLCPISALMRSDVMTDRCVPVSGTFETDLVEDVPAGTAP
jgi:hypothetical protein